MFLSFSVYPAFVFRYRLMSNVQFLSGFAKIWACDFGCIEAHNQGGNYIKGFPDTLCSMESFRSETACSPNFRVAIENYILEGSDDFDMNYMSAVKNSSALLSITKLRVSG